MPYLIQSGNTFTFQSIIFIIVQLFNFMQSHLPSFALVTHSSGFIFNKSLPTPIS